MMPALSPYSKDVREDEVPVAAEAPKPELRAIDCTTTKDWEQWARERREYDDPMGYERTRY
jgi:hypothetical protein